MSREAENALFGPLIETLKRAASALKESSLPFALAGSYAAYARGAPPSAHDVDFVILQSDAEAALRALSAVGMTTIRPPEDWLVKAYDDDRLVDLIYRAAGKPVTRELLDRADEVEVASVLMPVLSATDLVSFRLAALSEHACDFGAVLPIVRALREQIDWTRVRREVGDSPYAAAFLILIERLGIIDGDE
ncbi:nucleotidyltransferase family protein [Bailinhaonella thermotolerans]|uniref:nucleotidyltransferase family protein n=1 Tax=Bailinhaonella thermotolerans TaxID=1070861 RepID=UPI001F5B83A6|nr:nucleotidyltransferase family protein [Bailinhaonella thermotolerans]